MWLKFPVFRNSNRTICKPYTKRMSGYPLICTKRMAGYPLICRSVRYFDDPTGLQHASVTVTARSHGSLQAGLRSNCRSARSRFTSALLDNGVKKKEAEFIRHFLLQMTCRTQFWVLVVRSCNSEGSTRLMKIQIPVSHFKYWDSLPYYEFSLYSPKPYRSERQLSALSHFLRK